MWFANREVVRMDRWKERSACYKTKTLHLAWHLMPQMKNQD